MDRPPFRRLFWRWLRGWLFHPIRTCRENLRYAVAVQEQIRELENLCGFERDDEEELRRALHVRDPWGILFRR